tara:strand:- start:426 stop:635 length:210 start_codon:yes stop_codon:yes gene_type:complete
LLIFLIFSACSKPAVSIDDCSHLSKVSIEYVKCLENLINKSNTASNIKEFGKHKTGLSFFKKVTVNTSD